MKRAYSKPFTKKVEFSYESQVVAASNPFLGNVANPDNSGRCQQLTGDCNILWNASYGTATFNLNTCWKKPFMSNDCSE